VTALTNSTTNTQLTEIYVQPEDK